MTRKIVKVTPPDPWIPADYSAENVAAVSAVAKGTANSEQQRLAIDWIIHSAARAYDLDYRTDSRDHAFLSGRRFVGLQIVTACGLDISDLRNREMAERDEA